MPQDDYLSRISTAPGGTGTLQLGPQAYIDPRDQRYVHDAYQYFLNQQGGQSAAPGGITAATAAPVVQDPTTMIPQVGGEGGITGASVVQPPMDQAGAVAATTQDPAYSLPGQSDPFLASGAAGGARLPQIGYGEGKVDPPLAAAAGLTTEYPVADDFQDPNFVERLQNTFKTEGLSGVLTNFGQGAADVISGLKDKGIDIGKMAVGAVMSALVPGAGLLAHFIPEDDYLTKSHKKKFLAGTYIDTLEDKDLKGRLQGYSNTLQAGTIEQDPFGKNISSLAGNYSALADKTVRDLKEKAKTKPLNQWDKDKLAFYTNVVENTQKEITEKFGTFDFEEYEQDTGYGKDEPIDIIDKPVGKPTVPIEKPDLDLYDEWDTIIDAPEIPPPTRPPEFVTGIPTGIDDPYFSLDDPGITEFEPTIDTISTGAPDFITGEGAIDEPFGGPVDIQQGFTGEPTVQTSIPAGYYGGGADRMDITPPADDTKPEMLGDARFTSMPEYYGGGADRMDITPADKTSTIETTSYAPTGIHTPTPTPFHPSQGSGEEGAAQTSSQKAAAEHMATGAWSCFIAGTKISMADGTNKNIEDIVVGDKVKGQDGNNEVTALDPTLLKDRKLYSFNDIEHYFFTSEHPFMTEEGWKSIKPEKTKERDGVELYDQLKGELKVGDKLLTDNGSVEITKIKSKEMNDPEMPLYNFHISNDNSYIADNYIVHNKGDGGNQGCFLKGTLVTMADGSIKPVEQVDLGDEVAKGGKVFATGKFLVDNLHDYKGIKVSGSHMVSEDGNWTRIEDSKHGKPLGDKEHTVYVFGAENRRILINNILFTDYFEVKEQEKLSEDDKFFDNWKLHAKVDSNSNVNILNGF